MRIDVFSCFFMFFSSWKKKCGVPETGGGNGTGISLHTCFILFWNDRWEKTLTLRSWERQNRKSLNFLIMFDTECWSLDLGCCSFTFLTFFLKLSEMINPWNLSPSATGSWVWNCQCLWGADGPVRISLIEMIWTAVWPLFGTKRPRPPAVGARQGAKIGGAVGLRTWKLLAFSWASHKFMAHTHIYIIYICPPVNIQKTMEHHHF